MIEGFALEVYSWLVLVNNITPHSSNAAPTIPFDSFFDSLDFLREYETFGVFLGSGQGLFELIPLVSILARKKLAEAESQITDLEIPVILSSLNEKLIHWQSPPVSKDMAEWETEHEATGEIYRQALWIFTNAAMCGSVVNSPKVMTKIQTHIDIAIPLFQSVAKSPFNTLMLWLVIIIGSCMIKESQQRDFSHSLYSEEIIDVQQVREAARLLKCLWEDQDDRCYGPFGLQLIMEKHGINFSMA